MATSGTFNFELNVDQIIRRGMQVAGLLNSKQQVDPDDLEMGHDLLNLQLDELDTEGVTLRHTTIATLPLLATVATYTLPANTSDVLIGVDDMIGTIVPPGTPTPAETLVRAIRRNEYTAISNKTSQGTPVLCYIERAGAIRLTFWPIPVQNTTLRYQPQLIPQDSTPGAATLDVDRRRQRAFIYSLAFDMGMAKSLPLERVALIRAERDRLWLAARTDDVEHGPGQLYIAYGGGRY